MNSLTYLLVHTTKNRILDIMKSPGKLVAYGLGILFFGGIFFSMISGGSGDRYYEYDAAAAEPNFLLLKGILFGFFCVMFFPTCFAGLKGTSQYGMSDVNFLFVSPIRARTILLYGILQALKTIFIGSWFVLFQIGWLRGFGIGTGGVVLLWLAYVLFALATQMLQIFLYAVTNGNARRISWAKTIIAAAFVPIVFEYVRQLFAADFNFWAALNAALASPIADFTPVVGWAAAGTLALVSGEFAGAAIFLGLVAAFLVTLFVIIYVTDPDFYEHVSGATQTLFETQRAVEEGDFQAAVPGAKEARVKGTGLGGEGAVVFMYKHVRESFRAKRLGLWGIASVLYVIAAGILAYFTGSGDSAVVSILSTIIIIYFFSSGMERGTLEVYSHYIFMIPENPLKKWICANMESTIKVAVESVFIFGVAAIIARDAPHNFAVAAVTYITFAFYCHGSSLAFMRITGIASRSTLLSVLMLFLYIVPLLPGIFFAVLAAVFAPDALSLTAFLAVFTLWQTLAGLACFIFSKNMLHNCDIISLDALGLYKNL
ncbi:MAG: putative ABC exporter domain-containing protein [Defluviitaleaceae bacterium]|nr:putative ABC exporter domain-containing protein [Defluviitaleaceae bacterium]